MGKSTHTALWHELFGTPYLNGDLNLLGFEDGHITVYGIPWCGTSEIFTTEQYELGGIVLLGAGLADRPAGKITSFGKNPPGYAAYDFSCLERNSTYQEPVLCRKNRRLRASAPFSVHKKSFCCPHYEERH